MPPAPARRRPLRFALLALCLLVAGAALMSFGEGEPAPTTRPSPAFPTHMRPEEWERKRVRETLVLPGPPGPTGPDASPAAPERRDPFLVALPVRPGAPVVVFEANALRHSRLGELFVDCFLSRDPDAFRRIERDTGIDPLKDIDRVAFVGEAVVVSGFFDRARWAELEKGAPSRSYGDAGRLYREPGGVLGVWRDQVVVLGQDEGQVTQALDQLEGRAPVPESAIPEELAYGEAYGVVPGDFARKLLAGADAGLAERIAAAASRLELHVDAMQDVAAVLRVRGDDGAGLTDLAKTVGAALAVARLEAQATDDHDLAGLLEFAKVTPGPDQFSIELALPAERLARLFGACRGRGSAPEGSSGPAEVAR